ncbi:MAG: peptidyl-alpha-hydroxyglycine alpha-amidating lyase family protein, partial [Candidatus Poribacteria bacterium]|nr:peptidyl-alpha-hydroxyglycine alpha-amidating lyase family protein [Candidatus Poribacteria bacterium]
MFGSAPYAYDLAEGWGSLPPGASLTQIPAVACDSQDRVYVFSRSDHPLMVFDRDGAFLHEWDPSHFEDSHGIFIDRHDNVWLTDRGTHLVYKFDPTGNLLMTIGTPNKSTEDGGMFNRQTDVGIASTGEIFVSDGYVNPYVHKFAPDGTHLKTWGEPGDGPGQFNVVHGVRVARQDRVWICDRENHRIQIFDADGTFIEQWGDMNRPNTVFFDPNDDIVYVAELLHRVRIFTLKGELISEWGDGQPSDTP